MEHYRCAVLLLLVVFGGVFSAATKAKSKDTYDYDYPGDDDYQYEDGVPEENPVLLNDVNKSPPYFEQPHVNRTAFISDSIILPCDAKNVHENNVIFWYNGTQMLTQHHTVLLSHRGRVSILSNFSLKISNLNEYDSNAYSCDILPQKVTQVINLQVMKTKLVVTSNYEDITNKDIVAIEGDRVEFTCGIMTTQKFMTLKWFKKGERVENGVNGIHIGNGQVIIENVDHHHHGLYQCLADGGQDIPPHASVMLEIKFKPSITIKRHYVNAAAGDKAELTCAFHANPSAVTVFWRKRGKSLSTKGDKYMQKNIDSMDKNTVRYESLIINNVESSDYADYECVLRNEIGESSGLIHLVQEPEPAHFENMIINGSRVSLQWLARSKQLLSEAVLDYRINGSERWMTEMVPTPKHHETGVWKIQHDVELAPGTWHARIKTKNINGWSKFSKDHSFVIANDKVIGARIGGIFESRNNSQKIASSLLTIILGFLIFFYR